MQDQAFPNSARDLNSPDWGRSPSRGGSDDPDVDLLDDRVRPFIHNLEMLETVIDNKQKAMKLRQTRYLVQNDSNDINDGHQRSHDSILGSNNQRSSYRMTQSNISST